MSVVRLVSSREKPISRACSDCRFYHPKIDVFWGYGERQWSLSLWPPFLKCRVFPNAKSHSDATCSAFGGEDASMERKSFGRCKPEGLMFEPSALPCHAGEVERG